MNLSRGSNSLNLASKCLKKLEITILNSGLRILNIIFILDGSAKKEKDKVTWSI